MANVANRYADALFQAGLELNLLEEFYNELRQITEIFESVLDLDKILTHPKITKEEKREFIGKSIKGQVTPQLENFLYILIDNNRMGYLLEINEIFKEIYFDHIDVLEVSITTSVKLSKDQQKKLKDTLEKKYGKDIILIENIDPEIIGGVILDFKDQRIDGSIKKELEELKRILISES